jgi:hypothetical protein
MKVLGKEQMACVVTLIGSDEECFSEWWPAIKVFLPSDLCDEEDSRLLITKDPFLPLLVYGMELKQSPLVEEQAMQRDADCLLKKKRAIAKKQVPLAAFGV